MEPRDGQHLTRLPAVPLIATGAAGPVGLARRATGRMNMLVDQGRRHYGGLTVALADRLSEYWLARNRNPYREEIQEVAETLGRPGAFMLNLSYEWSCTVGLGPDPEGPGNRMLRTLDWPLAGLGRGVVVGRFAGEEGIYDAVTWPGFVGIATAMAPGRFSAAINQPPFRRWSPSCYADWTVNRVRFWREDSLPPMHLLRQVFDQCRTYEEARGVLSDTPLAVPALFSLSGLAADECCVIERTEDRVVVLDGPRSVANHWQRMMEPGHPRGWDSPGRHTRMDEVRVRSGDDFHWVKPPILNPTTRVSVIANAAQGRLAVLGWEWSAKRKEVVPVTGLYDVRGGTGDAAAE